MGELCTVTAWRGKWSHFCRIEKKKRNTERHKGSWHKVKVHKEALCLGPSVCLWGVCVCVCAHVCLCESVRELRDVAPRWVIGLWSETMQNLYVVVYRASCPDLPDVCSQPVVNQWQQCLSLTPDIKVATRACKCVYVHLRAARMVCWSSKKNWRKVWSASFSHIVVHNIMVWNVWFLI